jgi:cold-inducible RNA-binding protein
MNIYVGNLPYSVRDEELRATFEPFGNVVSAEVIFDKRTRRSRGYGFVEMSQEAEAQSAIAALNGKELYGRELRVDASQPKSEKPTHGASNGGYDREQPRSHSPRPTSAPRAAPAGEAQTGLKGFFKRLFS